MPIAYSIPEKEMAALHPNHTNWGFLK